MCGRTCAKAPCAETKRNRRKDACVTRMRCKLRRPTSRIGDVSDAGSLKKPHKRKQAPRGACFALHLAERVGFEPTVQHNCTPDFESGAFDHSATFPDSLTYQQVVLSRHTKRVAACVRRRL